MVTKDVVVQWFEAQSKGIEMGGHGFKSHLQQIFIPLLYGFGQTIRIRIIRISAPFRTPYPNPYPYPDLLWISENYPNPYPGIIRIRIIRIRIISGYGADIRRIIRLRFHPYTRPFIIDKISLKSQCSNSLLSQSFSLV